MERQLRVHARAIHGDLRALKQGWNAARHARVEGYLAARARPNFRLLSRAARAEADDRLRRWYPWLAADTSTLSTDQCRWNLYLKTLEQLGAGTGPFVWNQILWAISAYGAANRGLDFGVVMSASASSYPSHGYFAIDISHQPERPFRAQAPPRLELPARLGGGTYRYQSTHTDPAHTLGISALQDAFGKIAYGLGFTESGDIEPLFPGASARQEVAAAEQAEDHVAASRPFSAVQSRIHPRPERLLAGLGFNGTAPGAINPDVQSARSELLWDIAEFITRRCAIDAPFTDEALEGIPPVQHYVSSEHAVGLYRRGLTSQQRSRAARLLRDELVAQGFAERAWDLLWLLWQHGADPHRKGSAITLDHRYERTSGTGPAALVVSVFSSHLCSIAAQFRPRHAVPVALGDVVGTAGVTGNAISPHLHMEIRIRTADPQRSGDLATRPGLWPHEFFTGGWPTPVVEIRYP